MAKTNGTEAPRHSLAEIQSAIEAVMSRLSSGRSYDATLAASIAGNIHVAVNDPQNGIGALTGSDFERLVTERAPKLNETLNDPAAQLAAARAEASRANVTGAPLSDAAQTALGLNQFGIGRMARGERDGDGQASSARYDGMGTQGFTQTQLQARDLAIKSGMVWAANNPDLLRLGPSAIQALADVHLQKESYERFKNGGLSDKAIVGGARWAKRTGTDYNEFSKTFDATQQALPAADQKAHSQAVEQYFQVVGVGKTPTPAEEAAAKDTFNKAMEPIKQRNPQAVQQIEREQEVLKTQLKQEQAATTKADTKDAKADAMLAALNSGSPDGLATPKSETPPPASSSQTKPDAAKPPKPADRSAPKP